MNARYEATKDALETLAHRTGAKAEWDEEGFPSLTLPSSIENRVGHLVALVMKWTKGKADVQAVAEEIRAVLAPSSPKETTR